MRPSRVDISVVIPTYNRLWALPRAVASCMDTKARTEIIVVDDLSDDGSWQWLQEQDDVVSIQGHGWGKPWAVNKAFRMASGKYVRFLDSDDWLPKGVIDGQYELAEQTNADVVVAGQEIYEQDRHVETRPWIECDDFIAQQLGECDSSHYSAFLFKREFIENIPHRTAFAGADFASRDDRCFMIEVALAGPRVAVYDKPGLCHRHHTNGRLQFATGMRSVGTNLQHLLIYKKALRLLDLRGELSDRRKKAACRILWPLAHWIAYTHPDEAAEVAEWIFQLDPEFVPPDPGLLGLLYRRIGFRNSERILMLRRKLLAPFSSRSQ